MHEHIKENYERPGLFFKIEGGGRVAVLTTTIRLVIFVAALYSGPSFAAPTDCAEQGGQMECTGPQVASERYALCSETGSFLWISNIENTCGWGAVSGDADIQQKAACFSSAYTGCPDAQTNAVVWSKPGERYVSSLCWTLETAQRNGIDTLNFARVTGTATYRGGAGQCTQPGGYIGIVARRDRVLGCQDGWTRYDIPGGYQCRRPLVQVLQVSLTGLSETRPAGTGGISTIALAAKVTSGGQPKAGVAVNVYVDVTPNSGGHEHHDVNRPKGGLSATRGVTDANGEIKTMFISPDVAGIHTVKAECSGCSNSPATKDIQVKVPDLAPISPNSPRNADGSYAYALTSVDNLHEGNGRYHKNQYWLTENARQNLRALIESFAAEGWGTVALNDASLYWGGRYDINGNWSAPHQGHRDGREIDISFVRASNPISQRKQKDVYDKFCKNTGAEIPFSLLHHFLKLPHFHVYLEKQKPCGRTEK